MRYYTFIRTYEVRAHSFKDARIIFSRALENHEEDQYYLNTKFGYPEHGKDAGLVAKILTLVPWFLEEARNQIFGYPKYHSR